MVEGFSNGTAMVEGSMVEYDGGDNDVKAKPRPSEGDPAENTTQQRHIVCTQSFFEKVTGKQNDATICGVRGHPGVSTAFLHTDV